MQTFAWLACLVPLLAAPRAIDAADAYLRPSVCDLLANPADFDGKMITVRAQIEIAHEIFVIDNPACPSQAIDSVWLEYARGPKRQPTTWCCGDLRSSDPIAVKMDKSFRDLDRYLRARVKGKTLYTITATLSGRFDSVETSTCPDGKHQCPTAGGFGHFGHFPARLVIESATDVSAAKPQN
jgi:hypothetical protein